MVQLQRTLSFLTVGRKNKEEALLYGGASFVFRVAGFIESSGLSGLLPG